MNDGLAPVHSKILAIWSASCKQNKMPLYVELQYIYFGPCYMKLHSAEKGVTYGR